MNVGVAVHFIPGICLYNKINTQIMQICWQYIYTGTVPWGGKLK